MATVQVTIKGKVQGVFFRASAKKIAEQLKLKGYVKNLPEGNVLAVVNGSQEAIQRFVEWCRSGPAHAEVHSVETMAVDDQPFITFEIIR